MKSKYLIILLISLLVFPGCATLRKKSSTKKPQVESVKVKKEKKKTKENKRRRSS